MGLACGHFCSQKLSILGSGQLEAGLRVLRALTVVSLVGVVPLIAPASPAPSGALACLFVRQERPGLPRTGNWLPAAASWWDYPAP